MKARTINSRPFELGTISSTPGASATLHPEDLDQALKRHAACDWGACSENDWDENDCALTEGWSLFSVYHDRNGVPFWIITEADRSATTILLPSEY